MAKVTKKKTRRRPRANEAGLKNPLIFIDTNILLDFYRARNEQGLSLLKRLDDIHDRIVVTYQIEMEFKKNRQTAMLESLNALKVSGQITTPAYLKDHRTAVAARKNLKKAEERVKKLKTTLHKAMLEANTNDEVFIYAQRLFNCDSPYNLKRTNDCKYAIRRKALRRFALGYPPRKSNDTSIGDAINWEWAIECAKPDTRDLVIVSRDQDFGISYDNKSYINDWLLQEFKQRVSMHGRVRLTNKLSSGFQLLDQAVSDEELASEERIIEEASHNELNAQRTSSIHLSVENFIESLNKQFLRKDIKKHFQTPPDEEPAEE